ncbi:hypothetical protein BP6252_09978 [Coleophoma cylindrospora]|uniref:Uncharacterized protein n=1 Tax=Coleophoma cylindrospora TaxID=1849047 RepID=A0A3D8QWY4_9HELO|nr:hypothetical protein BP6252_09978 [Coleophoma cylindrospora]
MYLLCLFLIGFLPSLSVGIPTPAVSSSSPQSTACGDIVNSEDTYVFNASQAYDCLTSVPFNAAVASRFLAYYNDTLQFQSTLSYLKDPPSSYQQPAVDLLDGLNQLQKAIDNGDFQNQYDFEAALQSLLYAAHDGHVDLIAGILSGFSFASPHDLVSVSLDGIELPKVYLTWDLFDSSYFTSYQPSPVTTINGVDVITYLTDFAAKNSVGTLEPHADWNQLMLSPAQEIQGYSNVFSGGATFYPGNTITFVLENGTSITDQFLAIFNSPGPTGPLETGGDFYNFFVLGFYPASFDPSSLDDSTDQSAASSTTIASTSAATSTSTPSPLSWGNPAYPLIPDVAQPDLGVYGGGFLSGYFLNSSSVAVLSIPSFDEYGDALNTFQSTIGDFITQSKAAGRQKVVIDVQQNGGGQSLLAIDTFKQFFPNIKTFSGSRMRAHHAADVMGNTITDYWESLDDTSNDYYILAANEWVATDRLNADTDQNFTSWPEFFGPHLYHGDNFTTTQRYNLSSLIFDDAAVEDDNGNFAVYGYAANPSPVNQGPPFAPEDIIILSDGICDSSCSLFMEMMHHEAGVRVVVAGGKPSTGPMQAPSGSRGARLYTTDTLDANIGFAQSVLEFNNSPDSNFLPNRTEAMDVFVTAAFINLRDQVRRGETIPLQFAYEAADCRIFFTPQTVYNYTALWQYAADAIWTKPSLCVQGSTGFATTGTNKTDFVGPISSPSAVYNISTQMDALRNTSASALPDALNDALVDAAPRPGNSAKYVPRICSPSGYCGAGTICATVSTCLGSGQVGLQRLCLPNCIGGQYCRGGGMCQLLKAAAGSPVGNTPLQLGFCPQNSFAGKCGSQTLTKSINVGPPPPSKLR